MRTASVRKNAFLVAESSHSKLPTDVYAKALQDPEPRVRLAALRAMGAAPLEASAGALLLSAQASLTDDWSKAAATAAAAANPGPVLAGILAGPADATGAEFARTLAASLNGDDAVAVLAAAAKSANKPVVTAVLRESVRSSRGRSGRTRLGPSVSAHADRRPGLGPSRCIRRRGRRALVHR
jgi:hypothetical protein